jgi:hypothetical protein
MMTTPSDDEKRRRQEYDQRQYRLMLERLDEFLAGRALTMPLTGDLGTLLKALESDVDESWADEFSQLCFELETLNDYTAIYGERSLNSEDLRDACEIAEKLKRLVIPKIEPLPADE